MGRNKDGSVNYSPDGRVGSWDDYAGILLTVFLGTTSAFAAHESNNYAELTGVDGVTGKAHVNYVKGTEGWSSTVSVFGLAPGDYVFAVRRTAAGAYQTVCAFTADGRGRDGCSDQDADLLGFTEGVIVRDANGNGIADPGEVAVASGVFERRGVCREPDQTGAENCPNRKTP